MANMDSSLLTPLGEVAFKEPNNPEEKTKTLTRKYQQRPPVDADVN